MYPPKIEIRKENEVLLAQRPEAWLLVLILDSLEDPLREFIQGNGDSFEFTIKLSADRLSAGLSDAKKYQSTPPPLPASNLSSTVPKAAGGCLLMLAAVIFGLIAPPSIGIVIVLVVAAFWIMRKR